MLNIIKDNYAISLKREPISKFLAKAFEYLLNLDFNYGICAKIVHTMNKLKFRFFDLKPLKAMLKEKKGLGILISKVFEKSVYQMSNLRIGQDLKNYVIKTMLKLISKINVVFRDDFDELYKYTDENNITYLDENGSQFNYYFVPLKTLREDDFNICVNELMFFRTCDIKIKSTATTTFLVRAVKNKHFHATSEVLQRIFYDVENLVNEIGTLSLDNCNMYISYIGYILAHIPFTRNSTPGEFKECVEKLKGYLESIVDNFHPMTPKSFEAYYTKKIFTYFTSTFVKQFKKYSDHDIKKVDVKYIKDSILPVIRKILNFAVVGIYWEELDETIIDMCSLDEDFFLEPLLKMIQKALNTDEFRKVQPLLLTMRSTS